MLRRWCPAYSGRDSVSGSFLGTAGTSRYDDKGEMQVTEFISMRVPRHSTGAELPVVVRKRL